MPSPLPWRFRMARGRNLLFPRAAVPADVGARVRARRLDRGVTQADLAAAIGVDRRTVIRLEAGRHRPTPDVLLAIEEVLDLPSLVPGWADPVSIAQPSYGLRSKFARLVAGLTLGEAAGAAGVSVATLSRYERELCDTPAIVSPGDYGSLVNDGYARRLGFVDADDMERFCMAGDFLPWVERIRAVRDRIG